MQKENINKDFESFINKFVDVSGKIALHYFRQIRDLALKGDARPATLADKDIENYIRSKIISNYPTHNIIGEEFENIKGEEHITWYLDQIDGTRRLFAGNHDFGTLLPVRHRHPSNGGLIACTSLPECVSPFST